MRLQLEPVLQHRLNHKLYLLTGEDASTAIGGCLHIPSIRIHPTRSSNDLKLSDRDTCGWPPVPILQKHPQVRSRHGVPIASRSAASYERNVWRSRFDRNYLKRGFWAWRRLG